MNDDDKQSIENLVNDALTNSIDELSPEIQSRLSPMRMQATQVQEKKLWSGYSAPWQVATVFSLAIAVTLSWQLWFDVEQTQTLSIAEISPFAEVLQEDLEMLDELEFVYWMSEESEIAIL